MATRTFQIAAALSSIVVGVFLSDIPKKLSLYRWIASLDPTYVGYTPAFNYGMEEGYSFEELRKADLSGQVALVTGANSGIGFETARYLSELGASVTLACRRVEKCETAASEIRSQGVAKGGVDTLQVDVSSLKSVREFSLNFLKRKDKIDMLVLNAGIYTAGNDANGSATLSVDGIEQVFATNVVGHHLMYNILEPLLEKSPIARVVVVSSVSGIMEIIDRDNKIPTSLETLNDVQPSLFNLGHSQIYGRSKLAQVYWAQELTERLGKDSTIYVNSLNPGLVYTGIHTKVIGGFFLEDFPGFAQSMIGDLVKFLEEKSMWKVSEGALTQLYLAVEADALVANDTRGKYFNPIAKQVAHPFGSETELQKRVWEFLDDLVKDYIPEDSPEDISE